MPLPTHAQAVIIGAGVLGASTAYHLARLGMTDVVVVEKHKIGSGTTWHSAGNIAFATEDPVGLKLQRYALSLFPELEAEAESAVGWRVSGRAVLLRSEHSLARARRIADQ